MLAISPRQAARISRFVDELDEENRNIAREYVEIPNLPAHPELLRLYARYGLEIVHQVLESIDGLRRELNVHYDALQPEVKKHLRYDL